MMATTLDQITHYLDQQNQPYYIEPTAACIFMPAQAEQEQPRVIGIQLKHEGRLVSLIMPQVLMVKDAVHQSWVFQTLLAIAWEVNLLRWEYDPRDGEVRASIDVLLEDASLTETQFEQALEALIYLVEEVAMPRLNVVLATGRDPGSLVGETTALMGLLEWLQSMTGAVEQDEHEPRTDLDLARLLSPRE